MIASHYPLIFDSLHVGVVGERGTNALLGKAAPCAWCAPSPAAWLGVIVDAAGEGGAQLEADAFLKDLRLAYEEAARSSWFGYWLKHYLADVDRRLPALRMHGAASSCPSPN